MLSFQFFQFFWWLAGFLGSVSVSMMREEFRWRREEDGKKSLEWAVSEKCG